MNIFYFILVEYYKCNKHHKKPTVWNPTLIWNIPGVFKTHAEQKALEIIPKLLCSKRYEDLLRLLGLLRRSVILHTPKTKHSYKTYTITFIDWFQDVLLSVMRKQRPCQKNINLLNSICSQININAAIQKIPLLLTSIENNCLLSAFQNRIVYFYDDLYVKFKARLRSQDRTSGNKVWFPLCYISRLYSNLAKNHINKNDFSEWLNALTSEINIHYMNSNSMKINSCQLGKNKNLLNDVFLELEKNKSIYDVYLIWTHIGRRERVYTPTGNGNEKIPMSVSDISMIDIDHIKSIDMTLRDLSQGNKIPQLTIISDEYKQLMLSLSTIPKGSSSKNLVMTSIKNLIQQLNFSQLKDELDLVKNDGKLRLMSAQFNQAKGKSKTFIEIRKKANDYYGIIGYAVSIISSNVLDTVIYQNLGENGITRLDKCTQLNNWPNGSNPIPISKVPIDLL